MKDSHLKVAIAQISPVWLNKEETLKKIYLYVEEAGSKDIDLLVFGEALLPGYPYWLALADGAKWNTRLNKEMHAHYLRNAISIEDGDLQELCKLSAKNNMAIYLGAIERPKDRGGHSIYASLIYIDTNGKIQSVHRKLQPTYDERLTWAQGDGHGLRVHSLKEFTLGGLNCWENWMPLARAALYGLGENLHIAVWPGSDYNTKDITRFIARESRSYVISASSLMFSRDIPKNTPHYDRLIEAAQNMLSNGGSCIAGPDGEFIITPQIETEGLITADLDFNRVLEERQNFDAVGHYSRPDITKLVVDRKRQSTIELLDENDTDLV